MPERHAWIDESMRLPDPTAGVEGRYVLAVCIGAPGPVVDQARESLRLLLHGRQRRLHWAKESPRQRARIAKTIRSFEGIRLLVVSGPLPDASRQERWRRKCLERVLWELSARAVTYAWLERRTASLNRRDLLMISKARGAGILGADTLLEFGDPSTEPMLWVSDALAGLSIASNGDGASLSDLVVERIDL